MIQTQKLSLSTMHASLHGKDVSHRNLLRELFGLFYDARSAVVHGSNDQFKDLYKKWKY